MPACYTQGAVERVFPETSLLKLGRILYPCACYTPINMVYCPAWMAGLESGVRALLLSPTKGRMYGNSKGLYNRDFFLDWPLFICF